METLNEKIDRFLEEGKSIPEACDLILAEIQEIKKEWRCES